MHVIHEDGDRLKANNDIEKLCESVDGRCMEKIEKGGPNGTIRFIGVSDGSQPEKDLRHDSPNVMNVSVAQTVGTEHHPYAERYEGHLEEKQKNVELVPAPTEAKNPEEEKKNEKMREEHEHIRPTHHKDQEDPWENEFLNDARFLFEHRHTRISCDHKIFPDDDAEE